MLWLTDEGDGSTDPDKAMLNHDPSTHTTEVRPPPSWMGCQGSSQMKHFSYTKITQINSGRCLQTPQMLSQDRLSGWWKFSIIMQKRSPATMNLTGEPGVKSHSSRRHTELLKAGLASRQRLSGLAKTMESIITHLGDSLATLKLSILLTSKGIQAWNVSYDSENM